MKVYQVYLKKFGTNCRWVLYINNEKQSNKHWYEKVSLPSYILIFLSQILVWKKNLPKFICPSRLKSIEFKGGSHSRCSTFPLGQVHFQNFQAVWFKCAGALWCMKPTCSVIVDRKCAVTMENHCLQNGSNCFLLTVMASSESLPELYQQCRFTDECWTVCNV